MAIKRQIQSKGQCRSFTGLTARQGQDYTITWKYESGQKTKYFRPSVWETDEFMLVGIGYIRSFSFGWTEEKIGIVREDCSFAGCMGSLCLPNVFYTRYQFGWIAWAVPLLLESMLKLLRFGPVTFAWMSAYWKGKCSMKAKVNSTRYSSLVKCLTIS